MRRRFFPGGIIASLSIPWGSTKGDDDLGGYHLVWPRDLVETAGGAAGRRRQRDARRVLRYLRSDAGGGRPLAAEHVAGRRALLGRRADGRMRLPDPAGRPGAARRRADAPINLARYWPMVRQGRGLRRAKRPGDRAGPLGRGCRLLAVHAGGRDRGAAGRRRLAPICMGEPQLAAYLRETADAWNDRDRALDLCHRHARWRATRASRAITSASRRPIAPRLSSPVDGFVPIKNRPPEQSYAPGGFDDRQPRCAGAGALRPARGGRSAHPSTR